MEGKQPAKKAKKPNILFRLLALLVTAALVLGSPGPLVVYRGPLQPGCGEAVAGLPLYSNQRYRRGGPLHPRWAGTRCHWRIWKMVF